MGFLLIDLLSSILLIDNPDVSIADMAKKDGSFKVHFSLFRDFPKVGELLNRVILSSLPNRLVWMPMNSGVLTSKIFYAYSLGYLQIISLQNLVSILALAVCLWAVEDALHLFINCLYARVVWSYLGKLFNLSFDFASTLLDCFSLF